MRLRFTIGKGDAHAYDSSRPGASYTAPSTLRLGALRAEPQAPTFQGLLPNHPFNISLARADDAAEIVIAHGQTEKSNKTMENKKGRNN